MMSAAVEPLIEDPEAAGPNDAIEEAVVETPVEIQSTNTSSLNHKNIINLIACEYCYFITGLGCDCN
jgi:hypothetical protein